MTLLHILALLISECLTLVAITGQLSSVNQIINITLRRVNHRCRHHVACLWSHNQREVASVSKVATHFLDLVSIDELMQRSGLSIELISPVELNLLGPLEGLDHAIFHIEISDVDEDLNALVEQLRKHVSSVLQAVSNRISHSAVGLAESLWLSDVEGFFDLGNAVRILVHILERIVREVVRFEVASVHGVHSASEVHDVVRYVFAVVLSVVDRVVRINNSLLAMAP